jgi:hypothetical protein
MVHFPEIQQRRCGTEPGLDVALINPTTSIIPKWLTVKLLWWKQNYNQSMQDHEILYAERPSKEEQFLLRKFLAKYQNCEYEGRLKFTLHTLTNGDNC